jgi:hypothetical protein
MSSCAVFHKLTPLMMAVGKDFINLSIFIEGNYTAETRTAGQVVFVLSFWLLVGVTRHSKFSKLGMSV